MSSTIGASHTSQAIFFPHTFFADGMNMCIAKRTSHSPRFTSRDGNLMISAVYANSLLAVYVRDFILLAVASHDLLRAPQVELPGLLEDPQNERHRSLTVRIRPPASPESPQYQRPRAGTPPLVAHSALLRRHADTPFVSIQSATTRLPGARSRSSYRGTSCARRTPATSCAATSPTS